MSVQKQSCILQSLLSSGASLDLDPKIICAVAKGIAEAS